MVCKDICLKYKVSGVFPNGRYTSGQKWCVICAIYIKWTGTWCPCCGYKLRTKPRSKKLKAKLKEHNKDEITE